MAYPVSITTFPTLQDGIDYPQVAHVNPLGVEITAIETALLNGIPHAVSITAGDLTVVAGNAIVGLGLVVSGNAIAAQALAVGGHSSLAGNLHVAGPSTLAGAVAVGGNSSLTGNLHVGGTSTFAGAVTMATLNVTGTLTAPAATPRCLLTSSTQRSVPDSAWTVLKWDTEVVDSTGLHSTGATSSRVTFGSTGLWEVGASVPWNPAAIGVRAITIRMNNSSRIASMVTEVDDWTGNAAVCVVSAMAHVASSTDFATVLAFQNSGSSASIQASTEASLAFWARKVT